MKAARNKSSSVTTTRTSPTETKTHCQQQAEDREDQHNKRKSTPNFSERRAYPTAGRVKSTQETHCDDAQLQRAQGWRDEGQSTVRGFKVSLSTELDVGEVRPTCTHVAQA